MSSSWRNWFVAWMLHIYHIYHMLQNSQVYNKYIRTINSINYQLSIMIKALDIKSGTFLLELWQNLIYLRLSLVRKPLPANNRMRPTIQSDNEVNATVFMTFKIVENHNIKIQETVLQSLSGNSYCCLQEYFLNCMI